MIPLRDDVPSRTVPFVTYTFLALNVLAFLLELSLGRDLPRFIAQSAVVPALYTGPDRQLGVLEALVGTVHPELGLRLLVSMFLHGGWLHIIGNMLYLWIFGDNVEDRLGHLRFAVFYLACGWVASYAHVWSSPASTVPSIGASGAIAGVLGGYMLLYPHARVVTLLPLGFFVTMVQVPAVFLLVLWFVQQFLYGALSLTQTAQTGGVAWWAHIGGFVAGAALVWVFAKPARRPARRDAWWEESYPGRRPRGW